MSCDVQNWDQSGLYNPDENPLWSFNDKLMYKRKINVLRCTWDFSSSQYIFVEGQTLDFSGASN